MEEKRLQEIREALLSRNATLSCPRCSNENFVVIDETFLFIYKNTLKIAGNPGIPVILTACEKCGYIMPHATKVLGISERTGV